jgi:hypothetical protein
VKEHQVALADAKWLVACGPETGPLAHGVSAAGDAANGIVDGEFNFDDAGRAACSGSPPHRCDLPGEDHVSHLRHRMERVLRLLLRLR